MAELGTGVRVMYADNTYPYAWTEVPGLRSVTIPSVQRDEVESTIHGITALKTFIPGLGTVNPGELVITPNFAAASVHRTIRAMERTQTEKRWRFEVPVEADLTTTEYDVTEILGRVSQFTVDTPIDGLKEASVTIQFVDDYTVFDEPLAHGLSV